MNVEDILKEWGVDSEIDKTELGDELIKIPKLHKKYYEMYVTERLSLRRLESDFKRLKLEKHEFYTQGHNEYTRAKNWQLPARGMVLKTDLPLYMDGDPDILAATLKLDYQREKLILLEGIIKSLVSRGYDLKAAADWIKWTNGG